jgi:predicted thioesterase
LVALMEAVSLGAVDLLLLEGWSTVGTALNIKHLSATPVGMRVTAHTTPSSLIPPFCIDK